MHFKHLVPSPNGVSKSSCRVNANDGDVSTLHGSGSAPGASTGRGSVVSFIATFLHKGSCLGIVATIDVGGNMKIIA